MNNKNNIIFGVYCSALLIQNILALKSIDIWVVTMTAGVLISPIVFIMQDVEAEVFGFKKARQMILTAYGMNFLFTVLVTIAIFIPASQSYANQEAFTSIFATTPRIVIASFLAYVIGSIVNAKIMTIKKEKRNLFIRAISSTIVGQTFDNAIFTCVAFIGILPTQGIITMIIGATILETIYEVVLFPITKKTIDKVKEK